VHDDADEPRYFIAAAEDIGKRKQAEEEPQRTQERLRQSEGRFKVLAQEKYEAQRTIGKLTPREKQVLQALGEGLDSKDIAEKLHITVETERTHMVNILNKLDVHSRLQALVFAARHGLVEMH
jgi:DNA-binding NarL/FixJ family response regulator